MVSKALPTVDLVGQISLESSAVKETRAIASELCRNFYSLGWVSGTGGSISMKVHEDSAPKSCQLIVMSPSEMIKGTQGHGYNDELVVPIIENTGHEGELINTFTEAAECYHYVFDAAIKLHHLGMYKSTPRNISSHDVNKSCGCGGKTNRVLKRGDPCIDHLIETSHPCILLDIEAIMTPVSSVTDIPPFIGSNMITHLTSSHGSVETQHGITLLSPQGNAWSIGFERNALAGAIFGDIPHALERWHASDIKVYIFSSGSREAEQFILANSNYGNLRKYFCGFFGTSMGSKNDPCSYTEIVRTVGVDRPRDMLFVTNNLQEAVFLKKK